MLPIRPDTIARRFLWLTLPTSMLLMAAIWVAAALFLEHTIRKEGERFVERAAHDSTVRIRSHFDHLREAVRITASNELLVSALLDDSGRAFTLPAFMRSLRLPDISDAGFALIDYAGAVTATSGRPIPGLAAGPEGTTPNTESATLSPEGLRIVAPVRYDNWTEGFLVAWVPAEQLTEMIAKQIAPKQLGEITVRVGGTALFDECCETAEEVLRSRPIVVYGYPGLEAEFRVTREALFPAAVRANWFLLGAFGADIAILTLVSLLATATIARPLLRMVDDIGAAPDAASLSLSGYDGAPRELRFLADTLNAAAARIAKETQRRQVALRQAEAHAQRNALLAAVIEHSSNGIAIKDMHAPDQPIIYANPAYFRMTGYEPSEVIGRPPRALQGAEIDHDVVMRILEAEAQGHEIQEEIRDRRKDGTEFWSRLSLYPVREPGGTVSHIIGMRTDITEQRRLREGAARTAHLTSLGEMATGLAHELNQPLNVIRLASLNLASQLASVTNLPSSVGDKLARIQRNVDRAAGIIEHMKIFGRGDSGPPTSFRLHEAVEGALQIVGADLRNSGIEVMTRFGADSPLVQGKSLAVEQVIVNLTLNARDAILARRAADGWDRGDRIEFATAVSDGMGTLSVEDTGGGIPADIQLRIFEPFFTTKPPGQGTGLGLSLSFGIATELGGTLAVVNTARGARFELCLPLADMDEGPVRAAP